MLIYTVPLAPCTPQWPPDMAQRPPGMAQVYMAHTHGDSTVELLRDNPHVASMHVNHDTHVQVRPSHYGDR